MQSNEVNDKAEMFVREGSIVRRIWGRSDTILFVFAGASAEFALNKSVDWLYFTGRLPKDPMARLFSTVNYARLIVFATAENANAAIDKITAIHNGVEKARGQKIPDWAYRDVLFMLIYYSIAAFETLERKLSQMEEDELFDVFYRMGLRMNISGLPSNFHEWEIVRQQHLENDLEKGKLTKDLYKQYRKHLGPVRFWILIEVQKLLVPQLVYQLLSFKKFRWLLAAPAVYKLARMLRLDGMIKSILLPPGYRKQVMDLDR